MTMAGAKPFGSPTLTLVTGVLLVLGGIGGIVLPGLMALLTVAFVGWLFLIGGFVWGYHTLRHDRSNFLHWLKPVLLLITGGLMLFYPLPGIAAVGLLLTVYFLLDGFGSFALAHHIHPARGSGWMIFNGIVSIVLAVLFLIGWPGTTVWLVGIFVGISLLFDGWALIVASFAMRKRAA